jgi:hypothetical protein
MKNPEQTVTRQFSYYTGLTEQKTKTFTQKMREKIDTAAGKLIYRRRMATVEPVFANVRSSLGLDRFSLRGKNEGEHSVAALLRRAQSIEGASIRVWFCG